MDWQSIVQELEGYGLTQSAIGRYCGCTSVAISKLRNGHTSDPAYSIGHSLHNLLRAQRRNARRRAGGRAQQQAVTDTPGTQP